MKMRFRIFSLLILLAFVLGACAQAVPAGQTQSSATDQSASQTAADDTLYVNLVWHLDVAL